MEKVFFENQVVRSVKTGEVIGRLEPSIDSCVDVVLNNGCHQYAYYGTTNARGDFFAFCRNEFACGRECHGRGEENLSCRYNRKGTENAGYYVDIDATESTY